MRGAPSSEGVCMNVKPGDRVEVAGIHHAGTVTEVSPPLGIVRFRSERDGLVRAVDESACELKAAPQGKDKARHPGRDKSRRLTQGG